MLRQRIASSHTLLWISVIVAAGLLSFRACNAADLLPFGETEGDTSVPVSDDGSSPAITLTQRFVYFESEREVLFVNTNGVLSFQGPFTEFSPLPFPLTSTIANGALIAPYWDDVDITRFGDIFYRLTTDSTLLQRVRDQIEVANFGSVASFSPTLLFIATWDSVAEYQFFAGTAEENTFQVVLATDGQTSFVLFLYGDIQWGQANIGFNAGDGASFFSFPGSLTSATKEIETQSNVGVPGLYIYQVDGSSVLSPDDLVVSLEESLYIVDENDGGIAVCVVGQRGRQDQEVVVTIATEDSTAIGGVDYVPISVSQNITGGSTECITIDIINDATPENEEHFFVVLNVSVQVGQNITLARVNILDNDSLICNPSCVNGECLFPGICRCDNGYEGPGCDIDLDECLIGRHNCSRLGPTRAKCVNEPGGYRCSCSEREGYEINSTTYNRCDDINECDRRIHNCSTSGLTPAVCVNQPGSFQCSCYDYPGFELIDGIRCEDIDECERKSDNCSGLAQCINNASGGFTCSCDHLSGFTINTNTYTSCEDINECEAGTHNCSMEDPAPTECINIFGGFRCSCAHHTGYRLSGVRCEDVDECREGLSGCNHNCSNTMGSYSCFCDDGFALMNDSRTCIDINECNSNNGNCEQTCVNKLGSYQCECMDGFGLQEDGRSCEALKCPILVAPTNGTIECSNQTTGGNCNFSCQGGFNLVGSQVRMCLPSVTWSGSTTSCEPRKCETLEAPENGFVLLPCTGEYGSSCIIQCKQGYEINGTTPFKQTCLLENDELYWTSPPQCTEIDICESNPCQHGGSCTQVGDAAFECECEGTGYTGPTCNRGIVTTPDIPTLTKDNVTNSLNISALPDHELIITISGGESIQVSPSMVQLNATTTTASFTVTGRTVGFYSIQYNLSGEDASDFVTPEDAAVFVQIASSTIIPNQYFQNISLQTGILEDSCCEPNDAFFQCRGSNASNRVVLRSACSWESGGTGVNNLASAGVVFAVNQDFKLPISVAGIEVDSGSFSSMLPRIALGSCTPCPAVQPNCNQRGSMCYCYDFSVSDTIDFLESLSLAVTYIRNVRGLLPSWFQAIGAFPRGSDVRNSKFVNYEYTTDLVSADNIRKLRGCEMVQPDNDASGLYSVLRYGRAMTGRIDRQILRYIDRSIQPDLENPMCFAVNLCKGTESPVFIQLSPRIHSIILSVFLRTYIRQNWDIQIDSVVLSRAGISLGSSTTDEYWNGVSLFQPELPQFDLIVNTRSKAHFQNGNLTLDLSFSGKIHYLYQEREGVMDGDTMLNITNTIAARERNIILSTLTDSARKAVVNVTDINNEDTCLQEMSGIAFKLTYRQRPDQPFFSNLLSFNEETTVCPFDAFMNLNNDLELQGFSLYTRCPNLNLGRLTFIGMEHRLYFSGNGDYSQYCLQLDDSIGVLRPTLIIYSTLRSNRLPLGRFMSLSRIPENSLPTLVVAYAPESTDSYAKIDSVQVALLDTNFTTNITVASGMLEYTESVSIFDRYLTTLSVSASINEAPWERLPLTVVGVMDNGLDCSGGCFNEQLENAVHTELRQTGESAFRRQQSAIMSLNRSKEQVTRLESQLNRTVNELNEAMSEYNDALRRLTDANMTLFLAQQALDNATDSVREVMESTSRLCMESICEEICTPVSLTCYDDTYVIETARCPYTNITTRTVRVEPFFETRRVWRWEIQCYDPDDDTLVCNNDDCIPDENLVCYGVCVPGYEEVPIFRYENITVMIQKFRNCETGRVFNGSIPTQCNTSCGIRTPNATCVKQNAGCRSARQTGLEELEKTRGDALQPLRNFDEARQNISVGNSNIAIINARVMSLRQRMSQIQPVYQSAMEARNLAEKNLQVILNDIKSDLAIYQLYENSQENNILRIVNVTFNITITTQSPSQIPLVVTYLTPFNDGDFQKEVTFNFDAPAELSLTQLALEIIANTSLNSLMIQKRSVMAKRKVRRQAEPDSNLNRLQFEQNCADLQNVQEFFEYIADSFLQIGQSLETAREAFMTLPDDSDQINPANIIDESVLETAFNVTADENTFEELRERVSQDEEYKLNRILTETYSQLIADSQQAAEDNAFPDWQARLEILYNQSSSIGGYTCLSFTDCLLTATDVLEQLIANTPGESAQSLLAALPDARNELVQLGTAMNLTIPQAVDKIRPILGILVAYSEIGYWCASIPRITLQPPAEVNVSSGGTLNLECQADIDPAVASPFQWKKDGNPIPGANMNELTIENMQRLDSGNYTFCVSNPVGTAQSINTSVLVYELPEFYLTPVPTSVYEGQDSGVRLICNATAWPYPGWRWYFGPTENSSSMSVIDGEETNQLLIPDPQRQHEGWYTCEAYNGHGSIRADPVYLRVLPATVSQQAVPIEFQVAAPDTSDSDNQCTMQSLRSSIQSFLLEEIASDTTLVRNLELRKVSAALYTVTLYLISQNVTSDDTRTSTLIEIANRALPTRTSLQRTITVLRAAAQRDEIAIECGRIYRVVRGSLTTQKVTYMCPPGQQLSRNFLLCVSCEPGSYSSYRERSRVFNGEGLTERVPECIPCPIGSYEPRVGSDECAACPEFHTTSTQGAISRRQCTADPLLFECSVEGSTVVSKSINCLTNRPIVNTTCSFDDGIQQSCELPIAVDVQTFGTGFHSVTIVVVDSIGFTAETTVVYELEMESLCGGTLIGDRGSFSTPNWPETYPTNVDCEWTIELEDQSKVIEFNFSTSAYGIAGRPPCDRDWVEIRYRGAEPIGRFCFIRAPTEVISSAYQATVRFHAGPQHASSQKGFRINYYPVTRPKGSFTCGRFLRTSTPFGPPGFPRLLTSHSTRCVWRHISTSGSARAQLKLFYFDIPESDDCSRNSLMLHYRRDASGTPDEILCGTLSEYVFTSNNHIMTVTFSVRDYNTFRGFHAAFEQVEATKNEN